MTFQVLPLAAAKVSHLFGRSDDALAAMGVVARTADAVPGYPCRVSLRDAPIGARCLLLNHTHLDIASPYRSSYAIFVMEGAEEAQLAPGELPEVFFNRPLAVRGYDGDGMLRAATLTRHDGCAQVFEQMLAQTGIAEVQVYNAAHGCFAARVVRA